MHSSRDRVPTLYVDDEEGSGEIALPFKWEICEHCEGHGTSSAYLGAFTREDIDDAGEEFMQDYMAGRFDRACEHCQGGKVKVVDRSRVAADVLAQYDAQEAEAAECERITRQERWAEGGWREDWQG